jgi:hypothetical protein
MTTSSLGCHQALNSLRCQRNRLRAGSRIGGEKVKENATGQPRQFATVSLAQPTTFLYFMSETEYPMDELKEFLSKSKALVLERAQSDGVDILEEQLNQVLRGSLLPYIFGFQAGALDEPDLMAICVLISKHRFLEHVYLERSPFTKATDPWNGLADAKIDTRRPLDAQLQQLHDILAKQATLHKMRDLELARQIDGIEKRHSGSVTVVRGRAHIHSLEKACKNKNLSCHVFEAPLQGYQKVQEKLLARMAGDEEPNEDELKAALRERLLQGGVH